MTIPRPRDPVGPGTVNHAEVERLVTALLAAVGEDPTREGLIGTPERMGRMYEEIFAGLHQDPIEVLSVGFEEGHDEMVILREIPFYSMCEHHLLPFHGQAHIGYLPDGRIVGLSKIARAVEIFARRPQVQERLTGQIATAVMGLLAPKGVGVVIEAQHMCMVMRGVEKQGAMTTTMSMLADFRDDQRTRQEFMDALMMRSLGR